MFDFDVVTGPTPQPGNHDQGQDQGQSREPAPPADPVKTRGNPAQAEAQPLRR